MLEINFEKIALFLHRSNQPTCSSKNIIPPRNSTRPFHHVCTIIIRLLGKRQIFHSVWNRLNTKGNTQAACLIQGAKLKYKIRPRWTRFPLATRTYRIMNQRCPATDVSRYSSVCLSVQILRPVALPIFSEQARRGTRRANKLRPDKLEPLPPSHRHGTRTSRLYICIYIYTHSVSLSPVSPFHACVDELIRERRVRPPRINVMDGGGAAGFESGPRKSWLSLDFSVNND